jgi:hypothetical protein
VHAHRKTSPSSVTPGFRLSVCRFQEVGKLGGKGASSKSLPSITLRAMSLSRPLSNDASAARLISLIKLEMAIEIGPHDSQGPYVILQTGYAPGDLRMNAADYLLGLPARTTCSDYLLGLPARTTCSDYLLGLPARTTCSDYLLGLPARALRRAARPPLVPSPAGVGPKRRVVFATVAEAMIIRVEHHRPRGCRGR